MEASLAFYRSLGLELQGRLRLDPLVLYYLGTGDGAFIELADNPNVVERVPGTGHVALTVGDLDALLERADVEPETPPFHPGGRADLRVCFLRDPDGTRVELIEGDFPLPQD